MDLFQERSREEREVRLSKQEGARLWEITITMVAIIIITVIINMMMIMIT